MTWHQLFQNPFSEETSPLDYQGQRHPLRLQIVDPQASGPAPEETYFSETSRKVKNRKVKTPGASPGVVAFVDFDASTDWLVIHYMSVRRDQRGRRLSTQLLDELLTRYERPFVSFGDVYADAVWKYVERLKSQPKWAGRIRAKRR